MAARDSAAAASKAGSVTLSFRGGDAANVKPLVPKKKRADPQARPFP
jgi:hypothetical protein